LLVFGRYCLDVSLFGKIQDYEEKTLSRSKQEARQVTLDHIDPMCSLSLSSSHVGLHALILLSKPHNFKIWVQTWLVMVSHVVLSVIQVFSSFVMLSLACAFVRVLWSSICGDVS
jgi:hypothetical protein